MAGRTRTTKKLAQRINLDYFKTLHGIPRWRRILSAVFTAAGLVWLGWHAGSGNPKPYDAGPVGHAHSLFSQKCDACHVSGGFQRVATDQACVGCHDGPIHHAEQTIGPACSDCHVEHRGSMRLASTSEAACTQCHSNLAAHDKNSPPKFAANIKGFDRSHPEFAAVRAGREDPGKGAFNHMKHLENKLPRPHGTVELKCVDCHRPAGATEPLRFGQAQFATVSLSAPPSTLPGREYMAPVNYMEHCSAGHTLQFDKRIQGPAPHNEPEEIYDFITDNLPENN